MENELKAIEFWDNDYWRNPAPGKAAVMAFKSRQLRREEILLQIGKYGTDALDTAGTISEAEH